MKRSRKHRRRGRLQTFEGNMWVMPSIQVAREVYKKLLAPFLDKNSAEWTLASGFFEKHPVLAFLWDPTCNAPMAAEVARLATLAGGQDMAEEAKAMFLSQLLARRLGLQAKEPFDTLTAHHPKGKPLWDLTD